MLGGGGGGRETNHSGSSNNNRGRSADGGVTADGGNGGEGSSTNGTVSPPGEGLFLNMLRRLESIDVMGEDTPDSAAGANGTNGSGGGGLDEGDGGAAGGGAVSSISRGAGREGTPGGVTAPPTPSVSGVGSSFAGVGAKLRSKFRKPSGFGSQGGALAGVATGGALSGGGGGGEDIGSSGVGEGGKAFVEGASKALAMNRERVMGWMKELRPKDWSPKEAQRQGENRWLVLLFISSASYRFLFRVAFCFCTTEAPAPAITAIRKSVMLTLLCIAQESKNEIGDRGP